MKGRQMNADSYSKLRTCMSNKVWITINKYLETLVNMYEFFEYQCGDYKTSPYPTPSTFPHPASFTASPTLSVSP